MCGKKLRITHPLFIVTMLVICYDLFLFIKYIRLDAISREAYVIAIQKEDFPLELIIFKALFIVSELLYYFTAAFRVCNFKTKVANVFSKKSKTKVEFTQRFILLILVSSISISLLYIISTAKNVELILMPFLIFLINSLIVYYAFKYQVVFDEDTYRLFLKDLKLMDNFSSQNFTKKCKKEFMAKTVFQARVIQDFLIESKSYLKPEYTVLDLSNDLNFSPTEVSCAINNELRKNFSQLITDYRIEASKTILLEKYNLLTIEYIAELAGFKSRASFYRAFKDRIGITPSEYIKSKEKICLKIKN